MSENITFRKAAPDDASTLAELRICFTLELSEEEAPEKINALKKQLTDYFSNATDDNCISIIASNNNIPVGIGSMVLREQPGNFKNMSGRWGYIMNMYTLPGYRNRGICGKILELLVGEGKKAGITAFELHATDKGKPIYLKDGFQIHSEPTLRKYI